MASSLGHTTALARRLPLVLFALLFQPLPLAAQDAEKPALKGSAGQGSAAEDSLQKREQDLQAARAAQRQSAEAEKKLRAEIEKIGEDRRNLNAALLETANKVRGIESRIDESEARLKPLARDEENLRHSLDERRAVMAEILAALQRIGHHPPPAVILRPDDALQSLRTAMMLGAVLPDMRDRAKILTTDLGDLIKIRDGIASEKSRMARDLATLAADRQRMALLVEERQKQQSAAEKALASERERAVTLARQVDNLKDLILGLEQNLDSAARAALAAARSAEEHKAEAKPNLAALNDPGRLGPAIAFASAQGRLPLPVNGVKIRDFGASDGLGGFEKGISIATRAGAQVTSPCDGWVVYAGPFRSYGQLLILNTGGGYHVLLAGMERISVDLGQFVLTGEPVAMMGNTSQTAAIVPIGSSQPALYIEFRKDGSPVDSGPWWATGEGEKVRG